MAHRTIRIGVVALATAGLVTALSLGTRLLLRSQAAHARALIGKPLGEIALDADRRYKAKRGNPISLVVLGDSIAAGLGATLPRETLGARLAKGLSRGTHRAVDLRTAATVGAESSMLAAQLMSLPIAYRPDLAVIVVGGNDVTHRVPVETSVQHLTEAIASLRQRGTYVVVATCPDLSALRPVPQPLRTLVGQASRQLAVAQRVAASRAGAGTVDLAAAVGADFVADPDGMFSMDRFHPSALGYRRTAAAIVPTLLRAMDPARSVA